MRFERPGTARRVEYQRVALKPWLPNLGERLMPEVKLIRCANGRLSCEGRYAEADEPVTIPEDSR